MHVHSSATYMPEGNVELTKEARLAVWQAPGILLSPPPRHWNYRHSPPLPGFFTRILRVKLRLTSTEKADRIYQRANEQKEFHKTASPLEKQSRALPGLEAGLWLVVRQHLFLILFELQ